MPSPQGGDKDPCRVKMVGCLELVERTLDEILPKDGDRPATLASAMRHAVGSGGKRIRPQICMGAAIAVGGSAEDARYAAAAVELMHNYTLVHDDLPAMDDDIERRGLPTVWKKYGEANAILAGDALQALAFAAAAKSRRRADAIVAELADKGFGVVCGQVEDVEAERAHGTSGGDIAYIYEHKTSDLFVAAARMGAIAGGGDRAAVDRLGGYALNLGLAFQHRDDLLDGDSPFSRIDTERLVAEKTALALGFLGGLPGDTGFLADLAKKMIGRQV